MITQTAISSRSPQKDLLKDLEQRFSIAHILTDADGCVRSMSGDLIRRILPSRDGQDGCALAPGARLASVCPEIEAARDEIKGRWGRRIRIGRYRAGDGMLYLLHDETRRRAAGTAMREATAEAEAARRAKHVFMRQTAHDFRTPLSLILGNADLLLDPSQAEELAPGVSLALETIRSSGKILMKTIEDMLELMRLEAGRIFADPGDYRLWPLLAAIIEGRETKMNNRNQRLEFATGMAPALEDVRVRADRVLIKKALAHLFDFVMATSGVGATIQLSHSLKFKRSVLLDVVFPTGIYKTGQVMEAFHSETPLPEMGLTGLASNHTLPLAARFVALQGGKLAMSRARGRKVRLSLRIPRAR